jgi:predicted PurR-regulated permease PerM
MTINLRTAFFVFLTVVVAFLLYTERAILTPFVLAIIFAYIFNPVINFSYRYIKLPRTLSIIIIYSLIVFLLVSLGINLTRQITNESSELKGFINGVPEASENQINNLPAWIKPAAQETFAFIEKPKAISSSSVFTFFPRALTTVIGFFIFLFAGFYFLKDGESMFKSSLDSIPGKYKSDISLLFSKINNVLGGYLRGQVFMVFLVSLVLYITLSIVGIRFALILSIFSGFVEIIPIIGPIFAGAIAVLIALSNGNLSFGLSPLQGAIIVALIYFVIRQIQDYFVAPAVMGRIVKLHPLIILLAVLVGQHIYGTLGVILAVPVAGIIRILLEFSLEKIGKNER